MLTYIVFQNEKCHLLIEHETQKLKELDEEHSQEIKEWREKLRPRKKVSCIHPFHVLNPYNSLYGAVCFCEALL